MTGFLANVRVGMRFQAGLIATFAFCSVVSAHAAISAREIASNQKIRDAAFRTLKAATTEYTFEYVVIQLPAGSVPGLDGPVSVSHIRFKSTVFFAFSSASVEPSAEIALSDLARTVLTDKSARSLLIVGHTDSVGTDKYNATLSLNRAVAVAAKLREAGINDKLLSVVPMGEAQPIATNRTNEGKSRNRRVEFFISDIPEATRKAVELIKFNPCHRNDQDVAVGQQNPECTNTEIRIPVFAASGRGQPEVMLDLGRAALTNSPIPTTRPPLPSEVLERPSLKELQQD